MTTPDQSHPDLSRYHRQTLLQSVGEEGQQRLLGSTVAIVGCGALGCASADLLARAGIGRLILVDRDTVEPTNLQRQSLYTEADAAEGLPKAAAAAARLQQVNSDIRIEPRIADLTPATISRVLEGSPDLVVDGTDNFLTRYLLNDHCVREGLPFIYGGAISTRGMAGAFLPGGPCLRCLWPQPPGGGGDTCDTVGVLGPGPAIVGGIQASEAIRILAGDRAPGPLVEFELRPLRFRRVDLAPAKDDSCACCAQRVFEFLDRSGAVEAALCGRDAIQLAAPPGAGVELEALGRRMAPHGDFRVTRFLLRGELKGEPGDAGGRIELTVFADGRTIVGGTTRPERARAIRDRYIGG
ncbi:MAG: ThiF family adenylyltransferase [Phycisphaerales bacterium]|nr:ThiF family adenylyltransferase [Phycisphaerales bacterium]